ncbi:MAG TPA: 50S ribosomal protein L11 methyltransferase, partial [Leuconostoc mesenteroides]|nr:50S ribosomal protein L11 methyltransferase [Leuconostoc mesenteroides]
TVVRGGESMIDVGTGSGVLSVAAKQLGVAGILATDIDEMAVNVAKE